MLMAHGIIVPKDTSVPNYSGSVVGSTLLVRMPITFEATVLTTLVKSKNMATEILLTLGSTTVLRMRIAGEVHPLASSNWRYTPAIERAKLSC